MTSLEQFNEFCRLTGQSTIMAKERYERLRVESTRRGIIYPTTEAMRADTDRFTLEWVCRYCETKQERRKCQNCGAPR